MRLSWPWFFKNKIRGQVRPISFEDVRPVWEERLWPGRKSEITPTSAINSLGQIEMPLLLEQAYFWGYYEDEILKGVVSGLCTSPQEFRVRGIWVDQKERQKKIGSLLLQTAIEKSKELGRYRVWTMPRSSSLGFYQKNGFVLVGRTNNFEFGPHYFVNKILSADR